MNQSPVERTAGAPNRREIRYGHMLAALPRLMLACVVLTNCVAMLNDAATLVARVIVMSGQLGRPVVLALLMLAIVAMLDFFITDVLPQRYTMLWVRERRHTLYHAMALVLVALAIVFASYAPTSPTLWVSFIEYALCATAIAWFDLLSRPRE